MTNRRSTTGKRDELPYISQIRVKGFKSIATQCDIELGPLTVLAGANSSGKSSVMQAVLLLKQTLEAAPYDPGALKLNGENVHFTRAAQFISRAKKKGEPSMFTVGITLSDGAAFTDTFEQPSSHSLTGEEQAIQLIETDYNIDDRNIRVHPGMGESELNDEFKKVSAFYPPQILEDRRFSFKEDRIGCFRIIKLHRSENEDLVWDAEPSSAQFARPIIELIHVPGLRGNPQRAYEVIELGNREPDRFPGTFDRYVFSLVYRWQARDEKHLDALNKSLKTLGLAYSVEAKMLDETQGELLVSRLPEQPEDDEADNVSIADVGFGVSQVLPAVMALLAAKEGQLVYIEQPEIHLHPKAQIAFATLLAEAVERKVRVVVETHSSLLLLAIRTLVAKGELDHEAVKLHWFIRDRNTGVTKVTTDDLNELGAFDNWPEDFGSTEFALINEYMNAVNRRRSGNGAKNGAASGYNGRANGRTRKRTAPVTRDAS